MKIVTYQNQSRIGIPPEIIIAFGLDKTKEYDWVNVQGLPALRVRK